MLVRGILADFLSHYFLYVKSAVRHSFAIPIVCTGYCMSCDIAVEGGNVCEVCSQPSTSGNTSTVQTVAFKGMHY